MYIVVSFAIRRPVASFQKGPHIRHIKSLTDERIARVAVTTRLERVRVESACSYTGICLNIPLC